ncbi:hypothetical protein COB72_09785 [bacterium]|nr:MAG: hypothetical protein COB72_09785 [bacterium]
MTQMQSPYENQSDVKLYQEPERTSIMAILSMVFGIGGCCLGITSIPAILLGVFGLVGISRSKGRVGGTGFGIAGILIGLLTLALWVGLIFGGGGLFNKMMGQFGTTTGQMLLDLQADNFDAARGALNSPANQATDEEMIAFREGYRGSLGDFVSTTDGLGELISGYMAIGPQIQPYQNIPGFVPLPMLFDSGYGLVIYVIDTTGGPGPSGFPLASQIIVVDAQGVEYRLPAASGTTIPSIPDVLEEDSVDDSADEEQEPADDDGP